MPKSTSRLTNPNSRRLFLKAGLCAGGVVAASGWPASASGALAAPTPRVLPPAPLLPAAPPPLRITGVRFLRLQFPGIVPRRRNGTIASGGGPPGMMQLELLTDQGLVGRSFPETSSWSVNGMSLVEPYILPRIRGENPFFVERIWDLMYVGNRKPVAKGEYIAAMGAVDCAVWDLIGKALNLPVYKVLGGFTERIRVYAAGGYYEDGKGAPELAREMEGYVRDGFRAVKIKVGGESFAVDVERVRTVRQALGPDIDILIDANNRWVAYDAIRFGHAIEPYNIYWFEEPVYPDDIAGCAEVRRSLDIPVSTGENEFTRWGCRDLLMAQAADILNFNTVIAGGYTEYRKIMALASAFHTPVAPHGNPFMAVHLHASNPNTLIMETYPGVESQYNPAMPLFPVKDGFITVPDKPGIGIDVDPEMIRKYRVS
ncbi:MAG: mandelate racemase/muconate lactonizing enzyme family protein [Planctomycetes bacterium]|nr:mandelate racemase/muconate lactonizing enzyme family protein [Planctomycetota bacterium]